MVRPERGDPHGFIACYQRAWAALARQPLRLSLAALAWIAVQAVATPEYLESTPWLLGSVGVGEGSASLMAHALEILVGGPVLVGFFHAALRAVRGHEVRTDDVTLGFRRYKQAVLGVLFARVSILVGFLACLLPGLLLTGRLAAVPFLLGERDLEAVEALRVSWERTRGRWLLALGIVVSWIPLTLVGLLLCGVGVVPATALGVAALAAWYDAPPPEPEYEPAAASAAAPA